MAIGSSKISPGLGFRLVLERADFEQLDQHPRDGRASGEELVVCSVSTGRPPFSVELRGGALLRFSGFLNSLKVLKLKYPWAFF